MSKIFVIVECATNQWVELLYDWGWGIFLLFAAFICVLGMKWGG